MHGTATMSSIRGRPMKTNVNRDASGKSRGEIVDLKAMFDQPHRKGAKDGKSELLGYPLGRLRLTNQVSELQHRAGNEWALMVRAYAGMNGFRVGSPSSGSALGLATAPGYAFSDSGGLMGSEDEEKRIHSLRSRYSGCFEAMMSAGQVLGRDRQIVIATRRVCIEEIYPTDYELGDLRVGLNAVAKEMGIRD